MEPETPYDKTKEEKYAKLKQYLRSFSGVVAMIFVISVIILITNWLLTGVWGY